jgi:DnaJ-class molecular chaperone
MELLDDEPDARTIDLPCLTCQSEGRIYTQRGNDPDGVTDHGECPDCHGTGSVTVPTRRLDE